MAKIHWNHCQDWSSAIVAIMANVANVANTIFSIFMAYGHTSRDILIYYICSRDDIDIAIDGHTFIILLEYGILIVHKSTGTQYSSR